MQRLLTRLKFRHLSLILALEETGNLHRAAEMLNISQPNATKLLQQVEDACELPLFLRHPKGMIATPHGRLVARQARLTLNDLNRLEQDMADLRLGLSGIVRVGAIVAALGDLVPAAMAPLLASHPNLSISVVSDTSDALFVALQTGRIDLMIGRPVGTLDTATTASEPLLEEELSVVVRRGHPLTQQDHVSLGDLSAHRWILQPTTSPMRQAIDAAFTVARLPLPAHPVESPSVTATLCFLAQTDLIAVIPQSVSAILARQHLLAELPVELPRILSPYAMITLRDRPPGPALLQVMQSLRATAAARAPDRDSDAVL